MKKIYNSPLLSLENTTWKSIVSVLLLSILWILTTNTISAQSKDMIDCSTNNFRAAITDVSVDSSCTTISLEIKVSAGNKYGLSHFVVEVPCGEISTATNSGNWPMELNSRDPKSGVYGFKVDNIDNFGTKGIEQTFTVQYTVCGNSDCQKQLITNPFNVVFKAATCQFFQTITPELPKPELNAIITPKHITCYGQNNGMAYVTVTSGTEPYSYLWTTGETTDTLQNLIAGTYTVTVTDGAGKKQTLSTEITQPSALSLSAFATPTACNAPSGAIDLSVSGGTAPYRYQWSNGDTLATIKNLAAGQYSVSMADANGCTMKRTYAVAQNSTIKATLFSPALECHQEGEGQITATVQGGTAPYSYNWTNGTTTQNLTDLSTGRYQVTVTDSQGCSVTQSTYVTIRQLTASVTAKAPTCAGDTTGTASLTVYNGTAPYSYTWNTGDTTNNVSDLASGWYFVDITDANGCRAKRAVNIPSPTPININVNTTRNSCDASNSTVTVSLAVSGATSPYTWSVNNEPSSSKFETEAPDTLHIALVDANGCTASTQTIVTPPNTQISASATTVQPSCITPTGSATLATSNAIEPINALWNDGFTGLARTDLAPGEYSVLLTDAIGCSVTTTVVINPVIAPTVAIIAPAATDSCNSQGNTIIAETNHAALIQWQIISASNDWAIEQTNKNIMTYTAGTGLATITVNTTDDNGCHASATIELNCQAVSPDSIDNGNDGDGGNGNNNGGNSNDSCTMEDNYQSEIIDIQTNSTSECKTYTVRISTDGMSEHELSHLVIGISGGTVSDATVSKNWSIEKNITDPKSGVYGIKVDGINGFGQSGNDSFDVQYTVCTTSTDIMPTSFDVVYKAATCQWVETINVENVAQPTTSNLNVDVYPNPFTSKASIEFVAESDTNVELKIFDMKGNHCATLYNGSVQKGASYKFDFAPNGTSERIFFYQLVSPDGNKQGKLFRK